MSGSDCSGDGEPAESYAIPAPPEARPSPRRKARKAPKVVDDDAESAVTFACEEPAAAQGAPPANEYESQADAESEVTFADMLAGGVLHDMDMTGRPGRRPGARQSPVAGRTRSKAPVPAAKVKAVEPAVLQEEEEEEEEEDEETALDGATRVSARRGAQAESSPPDGILNGCMMVSTASTAAHSLA